MEIIIIDNHPLYNKGLAAVLYRHYPRCHITMEKNMIDGLRQLKATGSSMDLMLLGVNTQSIEGIYQLEELIQAEKGLPIIALPGVIDFRQFKKLLEIGVRGVVPKLYSEAELINAINECLKGDVHIPPEAKSIIDQLAKKDSMRNKIVRALHLTRRQVQVLDMMDKRMTNDEIAEKLFVSMATVKSHINKIYSALEVTCRKECIKRSYELGVLYRSRIPGL